MERDDKLAELIEAAYEEPTVSADLERRVMIEVARRAIERSRRRAGLGMVASLSGLAMLLAGCIAALVAWSPALLPAFTPLSRFDRLRDKLSLGAVFETTSEAGEGAAAILSLLEQWGGLILVVLAIGSGAGFIYYLNGLFDSDYTTEKFNENR